MSDKKESVDTTIKMVTATIDKHYHGIITSLQSQLEREQKCVELAFEALDEAKTFRNSPTLPGRIDEALTKIKSLKEGKND